MPPEWADFFKDVTVTGVLGLVVTLFLRGDIIAKVTVDEIRKQRDDAASSLRMAVDAFDKALDILKQRGGTR